MNAKLELSWTTVCSIDELMPNLGICAKVADRQVAIFKVLENGAANLFAIDNHDPFSDANVLSRGIVGDLKGRNVVASPIYKQHFDLATGECLENDDTRVPVYPIREHEGRVEVMIA